MKKTPEEWSDQVSALEKELQVKNEEIIQYRQEVESIKREVQVIAKDLDQYLWRLNRIYNYLMPTELPKIQGFHFSSKYLPSPKQGGDYFDIFGGEDKFKFGVVLSSASGHMMSALMLSLLLKVSSVGTDVSENPHEVIEKIRDVLYRDMDQGDHVELFYGIINKKDYRLRYTLLGDVYCFLHQSQTGQISLLPPVHQPLRLDFQSPVLSDEVSLNAKDRVILFSRGLVEVRDSKGEFFGLERVFEIINKQKEAQSPHELRNEILFQLNQFSPTSPYPRDVTLLVIEVGDFVIKLA